MRPQPNNRKELILAIYPNTRGFGYALFEGPAAPVDWGLKTVRPPKNANSMEQVRILLHIFRPSMVVLEDCAAKGSRRSKRIRRLTGGIARLARHKGIKVMRYSRAGIRECFQPYGAQNKDDIARAIGQLLSEFARYVPPRRKLWMSEHYRMGLFDAVSLALTYYAHQQGESEDRAA